MDINVNNKYAPARREEHIERFGSRMSFMPYVEIVEQPASRGQRFRYECEGRSAGSIPGATSSLENKTYPAIRIVGYEGLAVILVSCVTKDIPHKPHPHHIVGKEGCSRGVFSIKALSTHTPIAFPNLGIQCVKKKDIQDALKLRKQLRVDPFSTGFDHINCPSKIDLNVVRLCFQVYIEGSQRDKFNVPLQPVVTNPVYDKKAVADLTICKLSHDRAPVNGGLEMILLCEKVVREDIQVRFFEEIDENVVWEQYGEFHLTDVHKQYAITFRTPKYHRQDIEHPVQVYIQLRRPSDDAYSEPLPFKIDPLPKEAVEDINCRKRKDLDGNHNISLIRNVQAKTEKHMDTVQRPIRSHFDLVKTGQPEQKYFHGGEIVTNNGSAVKHELSAQIQPKEQILRAEVSSEDARYNNTSQVSIPITKKLPNGMANGMTTDIKTEMGTDMKTDMATAITNDLTTGKATDIGSVLKTEIPMETSGELSTRMRMQVSPQMQNHMQRQIKSEVPTPMTTSMITHPQMHMPTQMQAHMQSGHIQPQIQTPMTAQMPSGMTEQLAGQMTVQLQAQMQTPSSTQYRQFNEYVVQQPQCPISREQQLQYTSTSQAVQSTEPPLVSNAIINDEPVGLQQVTQPAEATKQSGTECEYGPLNSSLSQLDSEELAVFGTMLSEKLWNGLSISDPDLDNNLEPNNENDAARSTSTPFPEPMNLQSVYKPPVRNDTDLMIT